MIFICTVRLLRRLSNLEQNNVERAERAREKASTPPVFLHFFLIPRHHCLANLFVVVVADVLLCRQTSERARAHTHTARFFPLVLSVLGVEDKVNCQIT